MSVYQILAIIIVSFPGIIVLVSLTKDSNSDSHFESWRKKRHEKKKLEIENAHELAKKRLENQVELKRLEVEELKIHTSYEMSKIKPNTEDVDFEE